MGFKNYDSDAVTLVAVGVPITDGKGDPFVKIGPAGPSYGVVSGVDGEPCRYATHLKIHTAEVTLKGSSSHNAQLAALHEVDKASTGGAAVGAWLLKDGNGTDIYASTKCWISEGPSTELGEQKGDKVWKFEMVIEPGAAIPGGS
jgi:hypothetical protein